MTQTAEQSAEDTMEMLRSCGLSEQQQHLAGELAIGLLDGAMKVRHLMAVAGYSNLDAVRVVEAAFAICLKTETAAREHAERRANQ